MSITSIASNTSARVAAGVLGIAMALSLSFGAVVAPVHAQDASVIAALQAQIAALQAQLAALAGGSSTVGGAGVCPYTWTRDLTVGATGADVMKLQQYLNTMSDTQVSASGAGSPGSETQYFGPATRAAVGKYQAKNSIAPAVGYVGPLTRASLNSKCATATTPTTPGTTPSAGTGLMVSAAAQPANGIAVYGASRVPFTTFTVTAGSDGDVVMTGVVIQRTGIIQKAAFANVELLDSDGNLVGTGKSLNSNDQATVGASVTIPRGTSKTFTVAADMTSTSPSSYAGQVGGLQVVGINTSATVTGSLPISGASHTFNASLAIGTVDVTTSSFDPDTAQTKNIGDTNVRFAGVRVTAGSAEDIRVRSIRFYQTGSAGSSDIGSLMVNANGTEYPVTLSSDGKYYTTNFGSGIVVAKGFSADIYIHGDVVGSGAASRTVIFNLDKTTDLYVTGEKYGYGISPTTSETTASATTASEFTSAAGTTNPWFSGSQITIEAGQATSISKANEVPAQNIALNVQNQPLGGFATDFKGEAVTVQGMAFRFSYSSGSASTYQITSVSIVDENGKVVAGPADGGSASGGQQTVSFSDSVTFPTGRHVYTLKGKLPSGVSNGVTVAASTTPSGWTSPKGDVSGNSVDLSAISAITLNTMTVKAASLAITVGSSPAAQSLVAGAQGFTFATYQFDATQSGEDVRFSSIPLQLTIGSGDYNDLTNCKLYDGSTALNTGSNVVNPTSSGASPAGTGAETFTFDNSLVITKGTVKSVTLKCDVSSGASSTYKWGITSTTGTVVTGVTSNVAVVESVTSSTGNTMTVNTGALTVSTDSSSPAYKVSPAGLTDVVVGAFKLRPTNEDQTLRRIGLKLTNTASSSAGDLIAVKLYVGSTQIGQATFTGANMNATSTNVSGTGEMNYVLPKDTDTIVTVKADLGNIGTNEAATSGHLVAIDVDTNGTNTQSTGNGSGSTITASGTTSVAGVRIFKSVPTFTYSTTGTTLTGGVNDLLVLQVSADAKGEVQLHKLTFTLATTTAVITSPTFSGPNGNVSSSTNAVLNAAGNQIRVVFDSTSNSQDRVISAGQTKTYTLRATVTTGSGGNTVSTALKADSSFPSLSGFMAATSSLTASNIVWSPSSTSTASLVPSEAGGSDWTNGYGLSGCFASVGLGNDCTARVLNVNI